MCLVRLSIFLVTIACVDPGQAMAAAQYSDTRLIVKFRSVPSIGRVAGICRSASPRLDRILQQYDVDSAEPFVTSGGNRELRERLGLDRFRIVHARHPINIAAAVDAFRREPEVELVEPDYIMTAADGAETTLLPNDPDFPSQWGFRNTGSNPIPIPMSAGADIKATEAWAVTHGDASVIVAILDTGLHLGHPEFAGRLWVNSGEIPENQTDDDGNGYVDDVNGFDFVDRDGNPSDDLGHGTSVASVLGATGNNGALLAGLDWSCRLMPVRVLTSSGLGYYSWWAEGILYAADAGARILNMSLVGYNSSLVLNSAVQYAHASGCFMAGAMGNDDTSSPSVPAALGFVMAVGSSDPRDDRCIPSVCGYGSNFGPHIDVVAPGVDIAALSNLDPSGVSLVGGTSFATPMVAGLASLLLSVDPELTPDQLRDIIRYSADDQVGRPEEDVAGFDIYHGYGRINCYRALALARDSAPLVPARAFPEGPIRLMAANPTVSLRVEPIDGSFETQAISRLELYSKGTGTLERIVAADVSVSAVNDGDGNGVPEVAARFSKGEMRQLFGGLAPGTHRVPVTMEGSLKTGGRLRAELELVVVSGAGSLGASFTPQPMRSEGVLTVRMEEPGSLSVRIFDASGRLVRTLESGPPYPPGYNEIAFNARDSAGRKLRSGVYFYRAESRGEIVSGRLVVFH